MEDTTARLLLDRIEKIENELSALSMALLENRSNQDLTNRWVSNVLGGKMDKDDFFTGYANNKELDRRINKTEDAINGLREEVRKKIDHVFKRTAFGVCFFACSRWLVFWYQVKRLVKRR